MARKLTSNSSSEVSMTSETMAAGGGAAEATAGASLGCRPRACSISHRAATLHSRSVSRMASVSCEWPAGRQAAHSSSSSTSGASIDVPGSAEPQVTQANRGSQNLVVAVGRASLANIWMAATRVQMLFGMKDTSCRVSRAWVELGYCLPLCSQAHPDTRNCLAVLHESYVTSQKADTLDKTLLLH